MKKIKENDFYKWSVDKGDYKRENDDTVSGQKKRVLKKRIKQSLWILLYFSFVVAVSYYFFVKF